MDNISPRVEEYKEPVFDGDPLEPQTMPVIICWCGCE
jgi:hypothetical protein